MNVCAIARIHTRTQALSLTRWIVSISLIVCVLLRLSSHTSQNQIIFMYFCVDFNETDLSFFLLYSSSLCATLTVIRFFFRLLFIVTIATKSLYNCASLCAHTECEHKLTDFYKTILHITLFWFIYTIYISCVCWCECVSSSSFFANRQSFLFNKTLRIYFTMYRSI